MKEDPRDLVTSSGGERHMLCKGKNPPVSSIHQQKGNVCFFLYSSQHSDMRILHTKQFSSSQRTLSRCPAI